MRAALVIVSVLAAAPAGASAPQGGAAAFAVASGGSAYAIVSDESAADRVVVRRLSLDGGVEWERGYGSGRAETAVGAAVTSWGGVSVAGDDANGCFAAHWSSRGARAWENPLQYGAECHVRSVLVDADGNTYVLATTRLGDGVEPNIWKIDKTGGVRWSFRLGDGTPRYAFALALDAAGDGVTTTTARSQPGGWVYDSFDLDADGRPRPLLR